MITLTLSLADTLVDQKIKKNKNSSVFLFDGTRCILGGMVENQSRGSVSTSALRSQFGFFFRYSEEKVAVPARMCSFLRKILLILQMLKRFDAD